ncbi:hypothetical protein RDWZM_004277 [Blomia tropicalis]|uniref:Multidrug resistance-associated protein 1-like n=1 Tax=Blomia tropicalis TaxID=40697 RepID=A0A9Q0MK18_BLOTA|nr:hypothetical protein RDWZM_004277 [Blomia tropicalis]
MECMQRKTEPECLAKRLSIAPEHANRVCPENRSSFFSQITFSWFTSLLVGGYKKSLTLNDLWRLDKDDSTCCIVPKCDRNWIAQLINLPNLETHYDINAEFPSIDKLNLTEEQRKRCQRKKNKSPSIVTALYNTFGMIFWQGSIFKLIFDFLQLISPFLLKIFIDFISKPEAPVWHGYFLATAFFVFANLESLLINYYFHRMYRIGARIQTALISAIYRKSLQLSNTAIRETTTGEIVNLMSVDAQRFVDLMPYVNLIWSAPLRIVMLVYFIWNELGNSVFASVLVMVLMVPINWYLMAYQRKLQHKQMIKKDERVKVIGEILSGIKVIKLYGWEYPFIRKITWIRDKEIVQLREISYINTITSFLWTCAPFFVSFVSFTVFVLSNASNVLDAKKAFVSLAFFNMMQFPFKRINRFLNSTQLKNYVTRTDSELDAITIVDGRFSWEPIPNDCDQTDSQSNSEDQQSTVELTVNSTIQMKNTTPPLINNNSITLKNINLSIKKGSLVAIVGPVGSGKSSLISAILGDMERLCGWVNVDRSSTIAYCSQQAWIRNATLRENILFGKSYQKQRYEAVLEMCALRPDLSVLPGGDETEIGEKGINLSGGQKQRVSIARACYSTASLILLDDPLSAVDSHVASHLFEHVISSQTGYLKDRTRVLVTNNVAILSQMDKIVVLQNGTITEVGTYQELLDRNGFIAEYVREYSEDSKGERMKKLINQTLKVEDDHIPMRPKSRSIDFKYKRGESTDALKRLIKVEHTETGEVKASIYRDYFRSLTYFWLIMILFGYLGFQISLVAANVWLAVWSNDYLYQQNILNTNSSITIDNQKEIENRNYRLIIFGVMGFLQAIFVLFASIAKEKAVVRSSMTLHHSLLESIMHSPMQFFDTTPLGRIVNRFSKDIDCVDQKIPHTLHSWLTNFLQVVLTLVLITVQVPIFLCVVIPLSIIYNSVQKFYVATSRQLKRLESVTRSPIYSHFSETLSGVSTIRAFGSTQSIRLEFCGNLIVFSTAALSVLSRESFLQSPGYVGLMITYALNFTQTLNWLVRQTSEMETNVVAVERIGEYCQNVSERVIQFKNYSVRYRDGLDYVLKSLDFTVESGEKIGIVGRTGSGKSTLTLALFRILEPTHGSIFIDDVNIGQIGLHELRLKLSIIPQDPVLFSGSIRSNLDPFGVYSDELIWQALEDCHLRSYIESLEQGLAYQVAENGTNLSLGQRQLICLGRALLRHTRILVLDEATAAIDLETDALIQQTIRSKFSDCTILCIAHRLHTILDSTKILVLDKGVSLNMIRRKIYFPIRNHNFIY